jgi:hypothetical protein
MPRDANGNYTLPTGTIVATGDLILPSQHNPAMNDIASGLSNSLARNGNGGMQADLNMGGYAITNAGAITAGGSILLSTAGAIVRFNAGGPALGALSPNRLSIFNDASPNARVEIQSSGAVNIGGARGIGTNADVQGSGNLKVIAATAGGYAISTYDTQDYVAVQFTRDNGGAQQVGTITCTGTSTSYNTASDERLKTNFRDFDSGTLIDAVWVGKFDWRGGGSAYGVRAQQAMQAFPDAITPGVGNSPWSADYSKYVPLLLREVQRLRQRLASLEAR